MRKAIRISAFTTGVVQESNRHATHVVKSGNVSIANQRNSDGRLHGSALLIVLACIVIITGLVVGFLSSITNQATVTAGYAAEITNQNLADSAIGLTISQLRNATAGFDHDTNGVLLTNAPAGWASQPGLIRVFTTTNSVGTSYLYKLYSSTNMVDLTGTAAASNDLPPTRWWTNTAQYVDLNAPVTRVLSGVTNANYPIMDPSMTNTSNGSTIVDGFSINGKCNTLSNAPNPAAMPVVWLYRLKDGSFTVPSSVASNVATFTKNPPSSTNPIVGRIAFWADDETCKLNINTASEGIPWDPPSFTSPEESLYQDYGPAAKEFNRFPGHPFSVCLSPVLWSYFGFSHPAQLIWSTPGNPINTYVYANPGSIISPIISNGISSTNYANALFGNTNIPVHGILPRMAPSTYGSQFGSYQILKYTNRTGLVAQPSQTDRFYSSVDELNFCATNSPGSRATNTPVLTPQNIAQLGFFLTAESRAPEVNIFNLPRICLWPLNDTNSTHTNTVNPYAITTAGTARWSSIDQLIAYCSTLGTNAYYFTRYDPTDPGNDFTNSPRNQTLYSYLVRSLTSPMPGFASAGGSLNSFSTRWSTGACYEMATLCFDYIRSCINLVDSYGTNSIASSSDPTNPAARYAYAYTTPPTNTVTNSAAGSWVYDIDVPGTAQVAPICITTNGVTTRGMGRYPVIKSATLVFCAVAADQPPLMIDTTTRKPLSPAAINPLHPFGFAPTNVITNGTPPVFQTLGNTNYPNAIMATNQFPSWYPSTSTNYTYGDGATYSCATNGSAYMQFTNKFPNSFTSSNNYQVNMASNIMVAYNASGTLVTQSTNAYQAGSFATLTGAHALTISHSGLVYGGDINTNTGAFDAYNVYFGNMATNINSQVPGFSTNDTFTYQNIQIVTTNTNATFLSTFTVTTNATTPVTITATGSTNSPTSPTNSITIPNPASSLFPGPYQTVMQPVLILDFGLPTTGFPPYHPNFKIRVTGLGSLQADGQALYKGGSNGVYGQWYTHGDYANTSISGTNTQGGVTGYPGFGPDLGMGLALFANCVSNCINGVTTNAWPFIGNFVLANNNAAPNYGRTFSFTGTNVQIQFLKPTANYINPAASDILQTVNMTFPNANFPTPKLPPFIGNTLANFYSQLNVPNSSYLNTGPIQFNVSSGFLFPWTFPQPQYLLPSNWMAADPTKVPNIFGACPNRLIGTGQMCFMCPEMTGNNSSLFYNTAATFRSLEVAYGDWRLPMMMQSVPSSGNGASSTPGLNGYGYTLNNLTDLYAPHLLYFASNAETASGLASTNSLNTNFYWRSAHTLRCPPWPTGISGEAHQGITYMSSVGYYLQTFLNNSTNNNDPGIPFANIGRPSGTTPSPNNQAGKLLNHYNQSAYALYGTTWPEALSTVDFAGYITNNSGPGAMFSAVWTNSGGDFDNPTGSGIPDGPYVNKADEGSTGCNFFNTGSSTLTDDPYSGGEPLWGSLGTSRFAPNHQVPSAGILCSLPAGFDPANPSITNAWRTLQFCPNPGSSNRAIASANNTVLPPDYMILDLFNMPVVQPYPISDPFSTAGRVNLNYQIAPFTYIHRDSALRGVLKSIDIAAVPDAAWGGYYKMIYQYTLYTTSASNNFSYRYPVHLNQTLSQFDTKFSTNGFFRAGAEICSMWLYPALAPNNNTTAGLTNSANLATNSLAGDTNGSIANILNWWYANPGTTRKGLTGSNKRAEPYTALYGNITTKSNTYRIHYRVQTLKQMTAAHGSAGTTWTWVDPGAGGFTDKVLGEQRGSAVIERYIDPGNQALPDFASSTNTSSMDAYYNYRVFNAKQFTP